jgi:membrane-associated protease RseP (regulator of RpoE activity)
MLHTMVLLLAIAAPEPADRPIDTATPYPAFLGVGFDRENQPDGGALVGKIVEGTAAAKAGLEVGDVIIGFAGKDVSDQVTLRAMILERRAGEKVEVRFRRQGEARKITLVLDRPPLTEERLVQRDPPRVAGGTIGGPIHAEGMEVASKDNLIIPEKSTIRSLFLAFGGVLDMTIADRKDYAVLNVKEKVELSGMLYVGKSDLEFKLGDTFEIIRGAQSINGRFHTLWLPPLAEGLAWKVEIDDLARRIDRNKNGKHDVTLVVVKK